MANRIVSVHAGICGIGIYAIMLPSSGFSVAHWMRFAQIALDLSNTRHRIQKLTKSLRRSLHILVAAILA